MQIKFKTLCLHACVGLSVCKWLYAQHIHPCTHTHTLLLAFIRHTTISLCPQGPLSSGAVAGVVLGGLVFLIVLAGIAVCVGVLVYGYRNPTSKIGLFMIEVCTIWCVLHVLSRMLRVLGHAHNFLTTFCTLQHRPKAKSLNEKSSYNVESGKTAIDEKEWAAASMQYCKM